MAVPGSQTKFTSSEAPLLWTALALASGIILARYAWRPAWMWLATFVILAFAAAYFSARRQRVAIVTVLLTLASLGGFIFSARTSQTLGPNVISLDGHAVTLIAHVTRDNAQHQRGNETSQVLDLETESVQAENSAAQPLRFGVRATIYSREQFSADDEQDATPPALPPLRYGDRLRVTGRLHLPRNFGNPGAFDYREYLAERGISATIGVRADHLERLPGFTGSRLSLLRSRIRTAILDRIAQLWSSQTASLISAMLISERSLVGRDTRLDFQRSGTYHLLVVAGLHVGIIAGFVFWIMRRLRFGEITSSFVTLGSAATFAWIADDGVPIWRATLMLAIYMGARLLYRHRAPLNAIGAASLVLLAIDPRQLFTASFQLSFTAVLAIAAVALPLLERTSEPYLRGLREFSSTRYDMHLPPGVTQFRLDLRLIASRLARFFGNWLSQFLVIRITRISLRIFELLVISLVMQLALALPMAFYFHRATTFSLAANIIAVPLAGVVLPAVIIALGLSVLAPPLAPVPAKIAAVFLHLIASSSSALGRAADLRVANPSAAIILIAATAFIVAAITVRRSRALALTGIAALALAAVLPIVFPQRAQFHPRALEITAIDVGQGDSLLVITPDSRTLLIDSGGQLGPSHSDFDFGEDVVSPYLWSRGIRRLDAIALTHVHQDHLGGMATVLRNFHPRELWLGIDPPISPLKQLISAAEQNHTRVIRHVAGDTFSFGTTNIRVLAPPHDWQPKLRQANNDSLVLEIQYRSTSALLAGDVEKKVERDLARSLADQSIHPDLLKVAHHGSATSTTPELLESAKPRYAVISAGFRNSFGHPRADVLQRLEAAHIATYRTDTEGAVTFLLDGRSVSVAPR